MKSTAVTECRQRAVEDLEREDDRRAAIFQRFGIDLCCEKRTMGS